MWVAMTGHGLRTELSRVHFVSSSAPKHAAYFVSKTGLLRVVVLTVSGVLMFVGSIVAVVWVDFIGSISGSGVQVIPRDGSSSSSAVDLKSSQPVDVLVMGQYTRDGSINEQIGGSANCGSHLADTTMVMRISADRSYINLVSIPRDSLVDVPSYATSSGIMPEQHNVMFNSVIAGAQEIGRLAPAASCTMNALNALTGMSTLNFVVADFQGLGDMVNALGRVQLCIPEDTKDQYTSLKKGYRHLDRIKAAQYTRIRHGSGTDGIDIMRVTRQQYLVKELLKQAVGKNLLTCQ